MARKILCVRLWAECGPNVEVVEDGQRRAEAPAALERKVAPEAREAPDREAAAEVGVPQRRQRRSD